MSDFKSGRQWTLRPQADTHAFDVTSDSPEKANKELYERYISMKEMQFAQQPTPLQRRRSLGESARIVDADGYYVHVKVSQDGIPNDLSLIEVRNNVSEWRYIGDDNTFRVIERLPASGVFVFLY